MHYQETSMKNLIKLNWDCTFFINLAKIREINCEKVKLATIGTGKVPSHLAVNKNVWYVITTK